MVESNLAIIEDAAKTITLPDGLLPLLVQIAAAAYYRDYSFETPPEYLLHVGQVTTVARALVEALGNLTVSERNCLLQETAFLAFTHDIGRSETFGPQHAQKGAVLLQHFRRSRQENRPVQTGNPTALLQRAEEFASRHHNWGYGFWSSFPSFSRVAALLTPEEPQLAAPKLSPELAEFYSAVVNSGKLPEMIVLIADVSKAYPSDEQDSVSFIPHIAPLTVESGWEQLRRIAALRGWQANSEEVRGDYYRELVGMQLVLGSITYLEDSFQLVYPAALATAEGYYQQYYRLINNLWRQEYDAIRSQF